MCNETWQSRAEEYIDDSRRLGYALTTTSAYLLSFARFVDQRGHSGALTSDIILDWAQSTDSKKPTTWTKRLINIRRFISHCSRVDGKSEVPRVDVFGRPKGRPTPHIYTELEISELLAAARELPGTLPSATYETLFGLLASTGLRLSEALHLRCSDVDLRSGRLIVRQGKLGKSRLVPLHATVCEVLSRYLGVRQQLPLTSESYFFVSQTGGLLPRRTVEGVFIRLRTKLGWAPRGNWRAPRIHDLRHTFICRRVTQWHKEGADIDNAMLYVSTYVGHVAVTYTYWYLTGIPELMTVVGQRFEAFAESARGAENAE
ncbi:tyrosine-type recombinase/integrase [Mesorhizobium japonicum]|uniref:Integrase/recombinase n=1 Tax=Mesorhizobium japonicum (strain LMG 29417 / CECT 9101 / MAFF 303099) TaxID=266835 RepID=Q981L7_RHILO|nr:tyrosine-type recombinase/integrase [Mesorhizobium japonicum]BAB54692.1 integrase/recombinase [Mesorhizobium japonicum MAFF 303099]